MHRRKRKKRNEAPYVPPTVIDVSSILLKEVLDDVDKHRQQIDRLNITLAETKESYATRRDAIHKKYMADIRALKEEIDEDTKPIREQIDGVNGSISKLKTALKETHSAVDLSMEDDEPTWCVTIGGKCYHKSTCRAISGSVVYVLNDETEGIGGDLRLCGLCTD